MDVIFDWNLGNMIYNGLITLRHCGFPFAEIGVASVMAPAGAGSILCMASISGVLGGLGTYPYSVFKFAISGVVKAMAAELSCHGVRVNCISPHTVPTPMFSGGPRI